MRSSEQAVPVLRRETGVAIVPSAIYCLVLTLVTVAGCAVGPDFKKPEAPLLKNWNAQGDARISTKTAVDTAWWRTFHDPVLDRLVELAFRQNLALQGAGLRIAEARAQLGILTGRQFPQVQAVSGAVEGKGLTKYMSSGLGIDRNSVNFQVGFDAVWEVDIWGKYRRGVEAGAANWFASITDYYGALVSLAAEVARTYTVIRTFEVLLLQAGENARLQEESLQVAESRFRNGATSELDVAQATTLLESTRASIPKLEISVHQARNALSTLLGQAPGTVDSLLGGAKEIPTAPATVAISVPAEMLRRRPDIRSAELYAAAQCARIGVAKAELYPSFSLFGSIGLQANSSVGGSLVSGDSFVYSLGPRITWPFFNYGRLTNNVRAEDARFQRLLVDYRHTVLKAAQEVEDALVGFVDSQAALLSEQRAVVAAQRSAEIAGVQYREGAVDYQRVLDAQRALLEQQNNLAQTHSDVVVNVITLYKALGGGWQAREGQPFIAPRTQKEMEQRTDWGDLLPQARAPETKLDTSLPSQGKH
jgi:NodT family efflux transporter outer membrane factor (OMF) lipoprotein